MAIPTSRSEFRDYCLRKLGAVDELYLEFFDICLKNKYTKWYFDIIFNAKLQNRMKDKNIYGVSLIIGNKRLYLT